ncbi:outer membrane protein assembly factor BamB [Roseimicrobium gellanilyticum]|uniref:Outer membrane protein assembly factor BamB n=1 Tax=Roseimicrobium gellanilyticum TaxID=748857 RepID=A0A366HV54_9BACT|nr:PQQ-binding-like beta-propeller repeat protein [Roseimicrobium gellanilyticum]RBP47569.1 outer membrane protein assembly factor BamB [Roseimicrobium gellanilyticum]
MRRTIAALLMCTGASFLCSGFASAEDWPQWRGMARDNVWKETDILEAFPEAGVKVRWRMPVGPSWSSPVIADGHVYITDVVLQKPKATERLQCFEEASGKVLWAHSYEAPYPDWVFTAGQENGPSVTPIAEDGKVWMLGAIGALHCLDAKTGAVLWHKDLAKDYGMGGFSTNASPLIDGEKLVLVIGGKPDACVVALDKHTGNEIWHALDEASANSSPILVEAGGKRQLVVWTQQSVSALDPHNGAVLWRQRLLTSSDNTVSTPVSQGDLLLIGGLMLKLAQDKPGVSFLWPDTKAVSHRVLSNTSTAMLAEGHVYSATTKGELVCLDAQTGKKLWSKDGLTSKMSGTAIHFFPNGNSVLLYTDEGNLIRAKLTPQGYEEISRTKLLEPVYSFSGRKLCWSPPAFANGCAFARNERELVCAELRVSK